MEDLDVWVNGIFTLREVEDVRFEGGGRERGEARQGGRREEK